MLEAERQRDELEEAQQRAEELRRVAEEAANLEKAERELKASTIHLHSSIIWIPDDTRLPLGRSRKKPGKTYVLGFSSFKFLLAFYPRDAMLARVIAIATCLSVRLSVRHAPVLCQNEESYSVMISSPSGSPNTLVF